MNKSTTPIFLILVSLGLFYTFINPQYQKTHTLSAEAERYNSVIDDVENLERTRDELLVKYQALPDEEIENLKKLLPDNVDTVKLAMDLDAIGARYGISLTELKVSTENRNNSASVIDTTSNPYEKVLVTFKVIATYPNFMLFIEDVESSLRLADVRSVTFQSNDNGIYEFEVDIETYWLK